MKKSVSVPALVTNGSKCIGWQPCNNFASIILSRRSAGHLMDGASSVNASETDTVDLVQHYLTHAPALR